MTDNKDKPFKTMDIKAALLAAGTRKRKASSSPSVPISLSKNLKLSESISEDDIEVVKDVSDNSATSEFKENKDINSLENVASNQINGKDTCSVPIIEISEKSHVSEAENSNEHSSVEELDSLSTSLNTSVNALNTSGVSENPEGETEGNQCKTPKSKVKIQTVKKSVKRKMTVEEAKKRTDEREKKQQENLLKKQEIEAKKLEKQLEKEKRQMQKDMEKKKKEEEKKEREEEKKEKERIKQEKKEQEEKEKLQRQKEKDEKIKIKQIKSEMKLEEKKKKEEMKLKREEECKRLEEEKLKAKCEKEQKEKEKQERAKAAFFKFFKKENSSPISSPQNIVKESAFKPFQVSDDMTLAPIVPAVAHARFDRKELNNLIKSQTCKELYLKVLRSGNYKDVRLRKRQRKERLCDSDVLLISKNETLGLTLTAKLLQFSENVRPPYWGTWRKKSKKVRPRNPFGEDEVFDYTVDSDEEWDEGGPGESLSNTEEEAESEDDYEVDNEFFVPHGYLSAEEENEDEDEVDNNPEKQKALLKQKLQEFEKERKKKTTELKPIMLGCFFQKSDSRDSGLHALLQAYEAEFLTDSPVPTFLTVQKMQEESKPSSNATTPTTGNSAKKKFLQFPEEAMPRFIHLLHGNTNKRMTLIREFQHYWLQHTLRSPAKNISSEEVSPTASATVETVMLEPGVSSETPTSNSVISKRQLDILIKKISTYKYICPNPIVKKPCFWVNSDVLEKYNLSDLAVPNEWNYTLPINGPETPSSTKSSASTIKEFLKP